MLVTKLTTVCPGCGEPVDLFLMKKQLKQILVDMKLKQILVDMKTGVHAEKITVKETRLWK